MRNIRKPTSIRTMFWVFFSSSRVRCQPRFFPILALILSRYSHIEKRRVFFFQPSPSFRLQFEASARRFGRRGHRRFSDLAHPVLTASRDFGPGFRIFHSGCVRSVAAARLPEDLYVRHPLVLSFVCSPIV